MRVFVTIFLVWIFTVTGFAIEQNTVKLTNKNGDVFILSSGNNQLQIPGSVIYEQDTDDLDVPVSYCSYLTSELDSIVWKFQYNQDYYPLFYQICFSNLLIDLPPPQLLFI